MSYQYFLKKPNIGLGLEYTFFWHFLKISVANNISTATVITWTMSLVTMKSETKYNTIVPIAKRRTVNIL